MYLQAVIFLAAAAAAFAFSEETGEKRCHSIDHVFVTHNVFSKDEPNYFWLLGVANNIHIKTRESTLDRAMDAFRQCKSRIDPYEIERYFRRLPYIREARVRRMTDAEGEDRLYIETWDNWTLQPSLSFGRKGSENTWSVGLAEGNILGLGIASRVNYYSNPDRSGYIFDFESPVKIGYLFNTAMSFSRNDDGYTEAFSIESPFAGKDTPFAAGGMTNHEKKHSGVRHNGEVINRFEQEVLQNGIWWGWAAIDPSKDYRHRFKLGFQQDKHLFNPLVETRTIPLSREYAYPWFQYRFLSDKYTKMRNIYLINSIEDINLGIDFGIKVGYDLSPSKSHLPYLWSMTFSKAHRLGEKWLTGFELAAEGNGLDTGDDRFLARATGELFYTPVSLFTFYQLFHLTASDNQYTEAPVTLGDNNGLVGYPLQYSHGDHLALYQSEIRYYPRLSLFQLVEIGAAAFYGAGKVFGKAQALAVNNNDSLLQTLGIGLRFYSARSSKGNTLYLDFARPLVNDGALNRWEWRLRGKSRL